MQIVNLPKSKVGFFSPKGVLFVFRQTSPPPRHKGQDRNHDANDREC
jgi:hypothetical protein